MACPWLWAWRPMKQDRCHGVSKNRDRTGFATVGADLACSVSGFKVAQTLQQLIDFDHLLNGKIATRLAASG